MHSRRFLLPLLLCFSTLSCAADLPRVVSHDNERAAGKHRGKTLRIRLEIVEGLWYPDGYDAPGLRVPVFAESGRAPSAPGPLVRVFQGDVVEVAVRNQITGTTATVHGFHARPGPDRPLEIPAGEERTLRFPAGDPGTFFIGRALRAKRSTSARIPKGSSPGR